MAAADVVQPLQLLLNRCVRNAAHHDSQLQTLLNGALPVAAFGRQCGAHELGSAVFQV